MNKIFLLLSIAVIFAACNDNTDKHAGHVSQKQPKTPADSLEKEIEDGHLVGMSKMGKLTRLQQHTKHLLDSIGHLPAKAKQAAVSYKVRLDSLLKELDYADFAMNKWMNEYRMDSAIDNAKERMDYLLSENNKVGKVKEAILGSLARADSLFKAKK